MNIEPFRVKSGDAELACAKFGEGPPLILAHPALFSKAYFTAAADVFGARFSCVAFDQRGHGETNAPSISPAAMASDVAAVMDAMKWDKAAVGGTSLGAATTLLFALAHPERVSFLIQDLPAFGPTSGRDPDQVARIAVVLEDGDLEEGARRITASMSEPRAKAWTEALFADWKHYEAQSLGTKMGWAMRNTVSWRIIGRWPEELQKLNKTPVRIFAVQGDPTHPWDVGQTMARTIKGARLSPRVQSLSPASIAAQWVEALAS